MNRLNIGIAEDRDIQAAYYQEIIPQRTLAS